eukprot:1160793-Pelagomonas_calceolata.AAC.9
MRKPPTVIAGMISESHQHKAKSEATALSRFGGLLAIGTSVTFTSSTRMSAREHLSRHAPYTPTSGPSRSPPSNPFKPKILIP